MNNIYLGDAYANIDAIHDKWLEDDDGSYLAEQIMLEEAVDAVVHNYQNEADDFLDWLRVDPASNAALVKFMCYSLEKPRANGIETLELMLEAYAAESLKKLKEVRNGN